MTSKPGELVTFARGELLRQIEDASDRIWLVSPFLSAPVAAHIAKSAKQSTAANRRLITALVAGSVKVGVLDPKALLILQQANFEIASIRNLHAKLSIVDSEWGLVGSGNLTNAGLGGTNRGNAELGAILDSVQIDQATAIFDGWWQEAKPVSADRIEEFDKIERILRLPGEVPDYGSAVEPPQTDELEQILAEDRVTAASRSYWIKSAYHAPDDPDWWHRRWISDAMPPAYAVGDLIAIYLGKKNDGPQSCPAIVRVASGPREDRQWVIDHRDEEAADKWRQVTETTFVADVPIPDGVSLSLINKDGRSVQRGNCRITRAEFEVLARAMLAR